MTSSDFGDMFPPPPDEVVWEMSQPDFDSDYGDDNTFDDSDLDYDEDSDDEF